MEGTFPEKKSHSRKRDRSDFKRLSKQEKAARKQADDEETKELEKLVFGGEEDFLASLKQKASSKLSSEIEIVAEASSSDDEAPEEESVFHELPALHKVTPAAAKSAKIRLQAKRTVWTDASDASDDEPASRTRPVPTLPEVTPAAAKSTRIRLQAPVLADASEQKKQHVERKPAWVDPSDANVVVLPKNVRKLPFVRRATDAAQNNLVEGTEYIERLKKEFSKTAMLTGTVPRWADPDVLQKNKRTRLESSSESEADDPNAEAEDAGEQRGNAFIGRSSFLPRGVLEAKKLRDVSYGTRKRAPVQTVQFHRQSQILLAAYHSPFANLYKVDGKDNAMVHQLALDQFPIETAAFSACGTRIIFGSRLHSHFFLYDMQAMQPIKVPAILGLPPQTRMHSFQVASDGRIVAFQGRYGFIYLLSAKTNELLASVKMNTDVSAMCFNSDASQLYSVGDAGEVYVWDLRNNNACLHRFHDRGCIKGTAIALSSDDRFLACGSNVGVVNLYEKQAVLQSSSPVPTKEFLNLVTPINRLAFNHTSELLGMASPLDKQAIRMAHLSSLSVFSNFPSRVDKLHKATSFDFSLNSGYLTVGNDAGHVLLYRLQHYAGY